MVQSGSCHPVLLDSCPHGPGILLRQGPHERGEGAPSGQANDHLREALLRPLLPPEPEVGLLRDGNGPDGHACLNVN
jgi:hypothetical protein